MNAPFAARYRGRCAADCGEPIREGEWVAYVDDELMHEDCADAASHARSRAARPDTVCTACHLVHRGECP